MGSDFAKVDAYENTAADYDEIPDMADADPSLMRWEIAGVPVSEAEGRAAMAAALAKHRASLSSQVGRERVDLEIDGRVVEAFRAAGPDWRARMSDALRKAVGL